jgi:hypothetical protein
MKVSSASAVHQCVRVCVFVTCITNNNVKYTQYYLKNMASIAWQ